MSKPEGVAIAACVAVLIGGGVFVVTGAQHDDHQRTEKAISTINRLAAETDPAARVIPDTISTLGKDGYSAHVNFGDFYRECDFPDSQKMICAPDKVSLKS